MSTVGRNNPCPCGSKMKYKKCCGAPLRTLRSRLIEIPEGTDPTKIRTYHVDDQRKRVYLVTSDVLLNQLKRDAVRIAESFDKITESIMQEVSCLFSDAFGIFVPQLIKYLDTGDRRHATCAKLLFTAAETIIASAHLARGGFRLQYGIVARSAVETLATVLHLCSDPKAIEIFEGGRLNSSKSIKFAKQLIPQIGLLYGQLSDLC